MHLDMMPHKLPGLLVVICGPDGCGKSTLEDNLIKRLAEHQIEPTVLLQPTTWWRNDARVMATLVGESEALAPMALAAFSIADRLDHQHSVIQPGLAEGKVLISNRYLLSLAAHYLTTNEIDQSLFAPLYGQIIQPDLLVVLDAPTEVLLERVIARDGEDRRRWDQKADFVARNRAAFQQLARDNSGISVQSQTNPDQVLEEVWARLESLLAARSSIGVARELDAP